MTWRKLPAFPACVHAPACVPVAKLHVYSDTSGKQVYLWQAEIPLASRDIFGKQDAYPTWKTSLIILEHIAIRELLIVIAPF